MKKLLILPDIHIRKARSGLPCGEDKRALGAALNYAADRAPYDEVIQLGDFWDLPWFRKKEEITKLERHPKDLRDALKWYEQDLAIGGELLETLLELGKKLVILEGNHDYRFNNLIASMPHLEDRLQSPEEVVLNYGGLWVPTWSKQGCVYPVRDLNFIHGIYARQGTSAKATSLNDFPAENVFFGHTHWEEIYSPRSRHMQRQHVSMSCGCLCRFDQPYLGHRTTGWQHMFVEIFSERPGKFSFYPHRIFNGKFIGPDGKEYKG